MGAFCINFFFFLTTVRLNEQKPRKIKLKKKSARARWNSTPDSPTNISILSVFQVVHVADSGEIQDNCDRNSYGRLK